MNTLIWTPEVWQSRMSQGVKTEIFTVEQGRSWTLRDGHMQHPDGGESFSNKQNVGTAPEMVGRAGASAMCISGSHLCWAGGQD